MSGHKPAVTKKERGKLIMKIYTADKEAGNKIEEFATIEEAKKAILEYEKDDKKEGIYTPDFYDIVNEDCESLI